MPVDSIVVEFIADTSQVDTATSQLSEQEQKSIADGNAELTKRAALIKQNTAAFTQEAQSAKKVNDTLSGQLATTSKLKQDVVTLGKLLESAFAQGGQSAVDNILKQLPPDLKAAATATNQFAQANNEANESLDKGAPKIESSRSRLRAMREELIQLAEAGKQNTQEYLDLRARAGELADAVSDAQQVIAQAGSDTRGLDKVIRTASLATAGFGALQGAAVIFGDDNEELQKTLTKVNGIMLVLNSLQQIQTELTRDDSVVTSIQVALTNAWAAANQRLAVTFGELAPAVLATGIGAIAVAVGAVVIAYQNWAAASREVAAENENLKNQIDIISAGINGQVAAIKQQTDISVEQAKRRSASEKEVFDIQQNGLKRQVLAQRAATAELIDNQKKTTDPDVYKSYSDQIAASTQKEKDLQMQAELNYQQFLTQQYEKNKQTAAANAKAEEDISLSKYNYLSQLAQQTAANEKLSYDQRADALQSWADNEKKKLQIQADYELSQPKLTADQIKAIKDKHYFDLKTLQDQYQQQSLKLYQDYSNEEINNANATALALTKVQLDAARSGSQEELDLKNKLLQQEAAQQIAAANQNIQDETLREATIKQINADTNKQILDNDKDYYQKKRQQDQEYNASVIDLLSAQRHAAAGNNDNKQFEADQQDKLDKITGLNEALKDLDDDAKKHNLQGDKDYQTKRNKIMAQIVDTQASYDDAEVKHKEESLKKTLGDVANYTQQVSDAVFDFIKQTSQAQLQNTIDTLEKQKSAELDNANLTEQQKQQITNRYDRLEAQAKKQAALKQRNADIAQAIVNGLLAITKTFAQFGFTPAGFIAAAVSASVTAIDVAKIRSTPIPQFAKGTKAAPKGLAWVGEDGPELITLKGGERIYTNKESGNIVENFARSKQYYSTPSVPKEYLAINNSTNTNIDYDKLALKIGQHVGKHVAANVPRNGVNIDENGFKVWVQQGSNKTSYKNKRYKL